MGRCEEQRWREVSGGKGTSGEVQYARGKYKRMGGGEAGGGGEGMGVRQKREERERLNKLGEHERNKDIGTVVI